MAKNKTRKPIGRLVTFILIIAFVVGVILAIVFVNIFTPKSTTALAQLVNEVASSGYLSSSYENNDTIDDYLDIIYALNGEVDNDDLGSEDYVKIDNYKKAMSAYQTMIQFFDRELIYTTYTSTYKDNFSAIKSDFKTAKSEVDSMSEYLEENLSLATSGSSSSALVYTWVDCEENIDEILSCTSDAMERLMSVYSSCVDSKLMNNDFSTMVFKITQEYIDDLMSDETSDKSGIGGKLSTIANIYYTVSGEGFHISYQYDSDLQDKTKDLLESGRSSGYFTAFMNGTLGGQS